MKHERLTEGKFYHIYNRGINRSNLKKMWLKPKESVCPDLTRQLKQTAIKKRIPEGLHVYSHHIAVGFNQRNRHTHAKTGLQPHQKKMWLKPKELLWPILIRQLKQTAMDNLHGSPTLQGLGNLEGLKSRRTKQIPEGLHVYSQLVSRENTTPAGVARPHVRSFFYKHSMPPASRDGTDAVNTGKIPGKADKTSGKIEPNSGRACQPPGRTDKTTWKGGRQSWKCIQPELENVCPQYDYFNAVRSNDADRFRKVATPADLSACAAPDNVKQDTAQEPRKLGDNQKKIIGCAAPVYPNGDNIKEEIKGKTEIDYFNAVRSGDADRFENVATPADLSACAAPDNVKKKMKKGTNPFNANRFMKETATPDLSACADWRTDNVKQKE